MLKINTKLKKYAIPLCASCLGVGGIFLYQYLTFVPEYSHAEGLSFSTPVVDETIETLPTIMDITKMSELTSDVCGRTKTPTAFLEDGTTVNADVPTKLLIDDREGDDGQLYWVAKLANGNCWMTQNMNYGSILSTANANNVLNGSIPNAIGSRTINTDPTQTAVFPDSNTYNGHYRIGGYYEFIQTSSACARAGSVGTWDWRLPTALNNSAPNGSFRYLTNVYGITSGTSGYGRSDAKLIAAPLFFVRGGAFSYMNGTIYVGERGMYWSSTSVRYLHFFFDYIGAFDDGGYGNSGNSVRCLVLGDDNAPTTGTTQTTLIPSPTVQITVNPILTIDIATAPEPVETDPNKVVTTDFSAKVSSNYQSGYTLSIAAEEHSDLQSTDSGSDKSIPAANDADIKRQTNGWGIKVICPESNINNDPACSTNNQAPNYTAIAEKDQTKIFYQSTTGAVARETLFQVGISVSNTLPSGVYSTNIVVTAAAN